jgi:DNA-3-methyladenine glycosylase II
VTAEFALQIDAGLAHLAAVDPVMARLIAEHPLADRAVEPRLFVALVSSIVSQQLSSKAADTIMRRVLALVSPDGDLTPERLAAVNHDALRAAGLSNAKARYVRGLAEAVLSGDLDLVPLPEMNDEEVIAALTRMNGVGRWTAEMILLFSLGRPDVLSTGDLGIRNAVRRHYGLAEPPSPDELRRIADGWRPHSSTAMLLLWASLDSTPARRSATDLPAG